MKINYNGKEVGKWYHSDAVIPKAYINDNMVFPRITDSAPTPEYDVMCSGSISDYTGNAPKVYCFSTDKWYMRTIGGNYTEYGIYATGKPQDPYIGELAIDGGHEWEYTSNGWVDLGKTSRLPQGYTELEYIDSTDVNTNSLETFPAFIQTDYTPNYQSKFEYKAQILKDTEFPRFWGAGYWNNKNGIQMEYESYAAGTLRVMWLGDTAQSQSNVNGDFNAHTYVLDRNKMYRDDVLVLENNNGTTLTANSTLAIFTFHDTQYSKGPYYHTNNNAYLYGRMWYFNIYDDDVPVKKYIPAKRNNDNKVGFYDIVNDEFVSAYDGQSRFTTQFIAGPTTGGGIVKEYEFKGEPDIPDMDYKVMVTGTISDYTGSESKVYCFSVNKWYMRTTLGNYKEYGIYADQLSTDAYIGELAVYNGHEYEYTASGWSDLGELQSGGSLPVNVFSLNYNAKHMDGNTFLREEGQLVDADATINGSNYTINDGYVTIGNTNAGTTYCAVGGFQTYMNRNNSNPEITIISKAKTNPEYSNHYSLLCNRGNNYNWMWRPYRNKLCLHGGSGEEGNLSIPQGEVVIGSARVNSSRQLILNDWSNGTTNTTNGFSYGSLESGGFAMFRDYYNRTLEPWSGDFYWVFMCQSTLTDEEVQQVIQYNEEGGIEYIKEYTALADPEPIGTTYTTAADEYLKVNDNYYKKDYITYEYQCGAYLPSTDYVQGDQLTPIYVQGEANDFTVYNGGRYYKNYIYVQPVDQQLATGDYVRGDYIGLANVVISGLTFSSSNFTVMVNDVETTAVIGQKEHDFYTYSIYEGTYGNDTTITSLKNFDRYNSQVLLAYITDSATLGDSVDTDYAFYNGYVRDTNFFEKTKRIGYYALRGTSYTNMPSLTVSDVRYTGPLCLDRNWDTLTINLLHINGSTQLYNSRNINSLTINFRHAPWDDLDYFNFSRQYLTYIDISVNGTSYTTNNKIVGYQDTLYASVDKVVPSNYTKIASYCFNLLLDVVSFENNSNEYITSVGIDSFDGCSNTSFYFPSLTSIYSFAFSNCTLMTSFSADNVETIGSYAFLNCKVFTGAYFPKLKVIENSVFRISNSTQNNPIRNFTFPNTITTIGSDVFYNQSGIEWIKMEGSTPPTISSSSFRQNACYIYVPDASVDTYKGASGWSGISSRIKPISEMPVS